MSIANHQLDSHLSFLRPLAVPRLPGSIESGSPGHDGQLKFFANLLERAFGGDLEQIKQIKLMIGQFSSSAHEN